MRAPLLVGLLLGATLSSCDRPPTTAYYTTRTSSLGTPIGNNATGEACTLVERGANAADIYCGAWQQPSARVRLAGAAGAANLMTLATTSPWRVELESRFTCGEPKTESATAVVLQCARRSGGWPQIAMATSAGGSAWLADGTPASYPAIQRAVSQLSGGGVATPAAAGPVSAEMASYLAARAFSAGDIAQYEGLMTAGLQANLAGRPEEAEKAYRAALALQEKQQGPGSAAGAAATMSVALQLSDEGHYDDANTFFDRAEKALRAPGAAQLDANGQARLALYRGLNAMNLGDMTQAQTFLRQAETRYREQQPDALELPAAASRRRLPGARGVALGDGAQGSQPYATLVEKEALLGIMEARRNRAVAERLAGDFGAASVTSRAVTNFARANGLTASLYTARLHRTSGMAADADNQGVESMDELNASVRAFKAAQPRTRPTAEAELVHASILDKHSQTADALAECRAATTLLKDTKDGVEFERMQPCLNIFAKQATASGADSQTLLAEMFAAAQLTRGTVTDQEIRRTAVRLAAGGADPRVSEAIRQQQDADHALAELLRERDALGKAPADPASLARGAELDKALDAARAKLADADAVVQSAAPNYQQLIQQPVRPEDVFAVLQPNEAFVVITLAARDGWTFVLRDRKIAVARVERGAADVADLVKRLRASIEPGDDNRVPQFNVAVAKEIYDVTLGGVSAALDGATRMTVAPTGPLLSIPFETLLTGPANTRNLTEAPFLVRKFIITHVPAAANFVKLRQTSASAAHNAWFGFGDFRPITAEQAAKTYPGERCRSSASVLSKLPRLAGTQAELGLAARVFGAPTTDIRTGPAFTVNEVKALKLKDYRIIHFATHALLPAELACQDEPAIVTSAPTGAADAHGALLTASAIAGLKLDADAVILSACNSGGPGGSSAGESLAGLARSFFYAGARSLMVTHWTVEDEFATYLVAKTLSTLKTNPAGGLAAALQKAQLSFLARTDIDAPLKHPYYWAPFALVGEGGGHVLAAALLPSSHRQAGL